MEHRPCSKCGDLYPENDLLKINDDDICASCKPDEMQQLREGVTNHSQKSHQLSSYTRAWVITDIVFCGLRLILALLSTVGLFILFRSGLQTQLLVGIVELVSNLGIVVFGLAGNIMLLARKPWALILCYVNIAFTVLGLLVGLVNMLVQFNDAVPMAQIIGLIVGGSLAVIVRIVLLIFYVRAILQARKDLT